MRCKFCGVEGEVNIGQLCFSCQHRLENMIKEVDKLTDLLNEEEQEENV